MKNRLLFAGALLLLNSFAFGQVTPKLLTSSPGDHAHLMSAPPHVTLSFREAVNLRSAQFKVYFYPMSVMMKGDKPMSGSEMDVFAAAAARQMLSLKRDTAERMDTGLLNVGRDTRKVVIGLRANLKPGVYVTAWNFRGRASGAIGFVHFHFESGAMAGPK